MSAPGWYPDPGGASGQYRYWDGSNWTDQVTTQPAGSWSAPAGLPSRTGSGMTGGGLSSGSGPRPKEPRTGRRWLVALIAVAAVLVVVIVLAVRGLGGALPGVPDTPSGQPSDNVCPSPEADSSPTPQPNDGRVHSGPLSYPMLPAPWGAPTIADDVPFGRDVQQQFVTTEQTSKLTWGAAVMVGELVAGDGFFAPKDGAEIVLRCVTGTFYGNAAVTRHEAALRDAAPLHPHLQQLRAVSLKLCRGHHLT